MIEDISLLSHQDEGIKKTTILVFLVEIEWGEKRSAYCLSFFNLFLIKQNTLLRDSKLVE